MHLGDTDKGVIDLLPPHLKHHERPPLLVNPEVYVYIILIISEKTIGLTCSKLSSCKLATLLVKKVVNVGYILHNYNEGHTGVRKMFQNCYYNIVVHIGTVILV